MTPPAAPLQGLDTRGHTVLIVDDEPINVEAFYFNFHDQFDVVTATSAAEARQILDSQPVSVIVSDHLMGGESGLDLLTWVGQTHPTTVRILLTAWHNDADLLMEAINRGVLFRFAKKPWKHNQLKQDLVHAVKERVALLERESGLQKAALDAMLCGMGSVARYVVDELGPDLARVEAHLAVGPAGDPAADARVHDARAMLRDLGACVTRLERTAGFVDAGLGPVDLARLGVTVIGSIRLEADAHHVPLVCEAQPAWCELAGLRDALDGALRGVLADWVRRIAGKPGHRLDVRVGGDEADVGLVRLVVAESGTPETPPTAPDESEVERLRVLVETLRGDVEVGVTPERTELALLLPAAAAPVRLELVSNG